MNRNVIQYIAAAVIVIILGGFVGWFVFVRGQIRDTGAIDAARGLGANESTAEGTGSSFSNLTQGGTQESPAAEGSGKPAPVGFWGRLRAFFGGSGEGATSDGGFFGGGLFGGADTSGEFVQTGGNNAEERADTQAAPKLWQITRTPVAGHGFASSSPRLYFAERASGNILLADPRETRIERLTNTLFAKTVEAHFASDGSVILRSIMDTGEIATYAGKMATSTSAAAGEAPNKLEGVYLPRNIASISVHSAPSSVFFVVPDTAGGVAGITMDWQGENQKRAFSSKLTNWLPMTAQDGSLFIVQKASDGVSGYAYRVLPNGTLERVVSNLPGLLILPKSASGTLLYSTSEGGTATLYARARVPSDDRSLSIRTLAEKCVWAPANAAIAYCAVPKSQPGGSYVMNWYMGTAHTSDTIWKVDAASGSVEEIFSPDPNIELDAERLTMDNSGSYIAFMNATDKTLWMLSLNR